MAQMHERKTYAIFDRSRNKKLIAELEKSGASIVKIKPVELIKNENSDFYDLTGQIKSSDWLICADVYAAEFFLETLRASDFDLFELDDLHVCALGEAVAERLRLEQIHTDVIPVVNETGKIVESIENYIFDESDFAGKRFLLLKEQSQNFEKITEALEKRNAEVREAAIYRARIAAPDELPKIKALIKGGAIDEIVFTAPEDLTDFRFLFGIENLREMPRDAKISGADDATRQALFENGISANLFLRVS
jgi:uroporphyrinogen-III synthase